jgi:DNA-binding transcriptional regulator LsrR (DeoR family)
MEQQQNQGQWRRDKVQELCSKGYSQREISQVLQIGLATVNRDITYLRQQAKTNIKKYIDERLPEEYEKCLVGLILCYPYRANPHYENRIRPNF